MKINKGWGAETGEGIQEVKRSGIPCKGTERGIKDAADRKPKTGRFHLSYSDKPELRHASHLKLLKSKALLSI